MDRLMHLLRRRHRHSRRKLYRTAAGKTDRKLLLLRRQQKHSRKKRRQQTGRRKQGQEEFWILLSGLKKRWMGLLFVYLPEKAFSRKGLLCLWNAFLTANSRPSDLLWKIHVPRM